ncbi:hypothetical protein [Methylobacterium goesingense]|uniref:Uncharacterized protein n=1 Tax=Methylobacterium goesingense TaxID=243690 RepID=A0ABV2L1G1_9HYPH|nr:hypothetical protein [Methylobacterium goesingense]GJD76200.1 hypothetical protein CFIICLFH_4450 [Methylobacterium goesingense]
MGLFSWDLTPAKNAVVDPLIAAQDGASARALPATIRAFMAGMRRFTDDVGGAITTTGRLNAYVVTTNSGISDLRAGLALLIRADRDNTAVATLNVDGLGPLPWVDAGGVPLQPGRILKDRYYAVFLDPKVPAWRVQAGASTLDEIPGLIDLRSTVAAQALAVAADAASTAADRTAVAADRVTIGADKAAAEAARSGAQLAQAGAEAARDIVQGAVDAANGLSGRIDSEAARARLGERQASPKFIVLPRSFVGLGGGSVANGSNGWRVPTGQAGSGSLLRVYWDLKPDEVARNLGRPLDFVAELKTTIGFDKAFVGAGGASDTRLAITPEGMPAGFTAALYLTAQADTYILVLSGVLTGPISQIAANVLVAGGARPVTADASVSLNQTFWYASDTGGASDVVAAGNANTLLAAMGYTDALAAITAPLEVLDREVVRAKAGETTARTLAAPKFSLANRPLAVIANGSQFFDGFTSTGATEESGGFRIPAGQTGRNTQARARCVLKPGEAAFRAGRPARFVATFRTSIDVLNAVKDAAGNSAIAFVGEGSVNPVTVRAYATALDTLCLEGDVVFTGAETQITLVLLIAGTAVPCPADVTATLISTEWFVSDATGTTDVLDTRLGPLPMAVGELISVSTNFYLSLASGAAAAFQGRGFRIPTGSSGKGTVVATEVPLTGLDAGTKVRLRFAFQTSSDIEATTVLYSYGTTVDFADGSQGGASQTTLERTAPGIYEADVDCTVGFGARQLTYYLGVAEGSVAVPAIKIVALRQIRMEIVSTPGTTTASAQVQRYEESVRSRMQHRPTYRDSVTVAADGSTDFLRVMAAADAVQFAASADEPNTVFVRGGDVQACTATASIKTASFVNIVGVGPAESNKLLGLFRDDQTNQYLIQILDLRTSGEFNDLWFEGRNIRYPWHIESGNSRERAVQIFRRCTVIHHGATTWVNTTAIGVGHHAGNRQTFLSCTALSPTSAFGCHDNINWNEPASVLFEGGSLTATNDDGTCIDATSMGSGQISTITARGVTLTGFVNLGCVYTIPGVLLENHRANRYGYRISLAGCSPVDWIATCNVSCLALGSVAGPTSAVAFDGPLFKALFGPNPDVRRGAADYPAVAYSFHAVEVQDGEPDPGVGLGPRLGDLSVAPLSGTLVFDGGASITLTADKNYAAFSNSGVISDLNAKLATAMGGSTGGRMFRLAKPYQNRGPVYQPDREGNGLNVDTATILKGHALAWVGKNVRRMTGADTINRFAGIALDDAIPGDSIRFQRTGWINDKHLLFSALPASVVDDIFGVGATPGMLTKGADRGLLRVRQVATRGLVFEILDPNRADAGVFSAAKAAPTNFTIMGDYEDFLQMDFVATGRTLSATADLAFLQKGSAPVQGLARLKLTDVGTGAVLTFGATRGEIAVPNVLCKRGEIGLIARNLQIGGAYRVTVQAYRGTTDGSTEVHDQYLQATCA